MGYSYLGTAKAPVAVSIPDDGDPPMAGTWAPCLEAHQDFIQKVWGKVHLAGGMMIQPYESTSYDDEDTSHTFFSTASTGTYLDTGADVTVYDTEIGDWVDVTCAFGVKGPFSGDVACFRLLAVDDSTGTPSNVAITGARAQTANDDLHMITITGRHYITAAGNTQIKLQACMYTGSSATLYITAIVNTVTQHWRGV